MLFSEADVPAKVAINESIELSKTFGHKKSFKFISGVMGNIYDISGLKGRDDKVEAKEQDKEYSLASIEDKVGAMVFSKKMGRFI